MMIKYETRLKAKALRKKRSGAALYTLVVFNAFLLGMLGLSALAVSRIERRQNQSGIDAIQAKRLANSGIRLAKLSMDQDKNWRTSFQHNVKASEKFLGRGTIQYLIEDLNDSDLADDAGDNIAITAVGEFGDAVWSEQVHAEPIMGPPEFLTMSLHAGLDIRVLSTARVRMASAPISTNKELHLDGQLQGSVECLSQIGGGILSGLISSNQSPKSLPNASVFSDYHAKATALSYSGSMNGVVITPAVNTYGGGISSEGIYYINPGNNTLLLEGIRIEGTLLVDGDVEIRNAAYLKTANQLYPSLIVNGNLAINLESRTRHLRESDFNHNFNPVGAEYLGSSDTDEVDQYPNQIEGLIHVRGNLTTANSPYIEGCLVCEGTAALDGSLEIQHDSTLYSHPPVGYEELPGPKVQFIPGTWKRVAAP